MTRDRLTQLAILAVLVAIGIWIAFNTYWAEVEVTTPLQGEAATNPYYSLEHLSHALGMRTQRVASLRSLPPGDDVLLMTELSNDEAHGRLDALEHWVQGGGRLVVTPSIVWSSPPLQKWSGIAPAHRDATPRPGIQPPVVSAPAASAAPSTSAAPTGSPSPATPAASPASATPAARTAPTTSAAPAIPAAPTTFAAPATPTAPPASTIPATPNAPPASATPATPAAPARPTSVRTRPPIHSNPDSDCAPMTVEKQGEATGARLQICRPKSEFSFVSKRHPTWSLSNDRGLQMLRVDIGRGALTVVGPEFLWLPRTLLRGDNAQGFIDGAQLGKGDRLLIFTPSRAEPLLAMLWRVAAPAIVCFGLGIALVILRHLPRFGPPAPVSAAARRSLAEQLRANARFAWRAGNVKSLRRAVLRALEHSAAQHIAGYGSFTARRRAAELGKRAGVDASLLNSAMTEDAAGTPSVQRAAIALLEQTRRALTNSNPTQGTVHDR